VASEDDQTQQVKRATVTRAKLGTSTRVSCAVRRWPLVAEEQDAPDVTRYARMNKTPPQVRLDGTDREPREGQTAGSPRVENGDTLREARLATRGGDQWRTPSTAGPDPPWRRRRIMANQPTAWSGWRGRVGRRRCALR